MIVGGGDVVPFRTAVGASPGCDESMPLSIVSICDVRGFADGSKVILRSPAFFLWLCRRVWASVMMLVSLVVGGVDRNCDDFGGRPRRFGCVR